MVDKLSKSWASQKMENYAAVRKREKKDGTFNMLTWSDLPKIRH